MKTREMNTLNVMTYSVEFTMQHFFLHGIGLLGIITRASQAMGVVEERNIIVQKKKKGYSLHLLGACASTRAKQTDGATNSVIKDVHFHRFRVFVS